MTFFLNAYDTHTKSPGFDGLPLFRASEGCVILRCMEKSDHHDNPTTPIRGEELNSALSLLLDALAPLGPLGAQILWIFQPVGGLFGSRGSIGRLAEALEEPGGIDRLREQLDAAQSESGQQDVAR